MKPSFMAIVILVQSVHILETFTVKICMVLTLIFRIDPEPTNSLLRHMVCQNKCIIIIKLKSNYVN